MWLNFANHGGSGISHGDGDDSDFKSSSGGSWGGGAQNHGIITNYDVGSGKDIDVHKLMQGLYDTYPTDQVHQLKDAVGVEWRCSNIQFI